jgi:hypothetical protein
MRRVRRSPARAQGVAPHPAQGPGARRLHAYCPARSCPYDRIRSLSDNGRQYPHLEPLDKGLIEAARSLARDGYPASAVIAAHAATEVVTEFVIGCGLEWRGLPELEKPLGMSIRAYNLHNQYVRSLYVAVTGDKRLWERYGSQFGEHAERRHRAAHGGRVSFEEAEASVALADQVQRHLMAVVGDLHDRYVGD